MTRPAQPVVLVTGASSGIGNATATLLRQHGYTVHATARNVGDLAPLERSGCHTHALDVTDEASMQRAIQAIGAVDVLVNNAGYGLNGVVEELEMRDLRAQFETNVFGLVRMSQLVLPAMRARGWGRIINIGSVGGSFTAPGSGAYHASKYAVEALNDALRMEVEAFGIDVVLLKPTGVYTRFDAKIASTFKDIPASPYAAFKANHARVTAQMFQPRSRAGIIRPEDVARVVLQAADARRPKTRYTVGLSATLYLALRRLLPDRAWDAMMRAQFGTRGSGGAVHSGA
jgi:NAD(P)-dependent dehydrogenase (short-subunit alcohol dehydrogenase family)